MIVLVCGGRHYEDHREVRRRLAFLDPGDLLIHGGATGADAHADQIARERGVHVAGVDALWGKYGKQAGPRRNAAMLALKPDLVIAFPGGRGTANCVEQARALGIDVELVAGQEPAAETAPRDPDFEPIVLGPGEVAPFVDALEPGTCWIDGEPVG